MAFAGLLLGALPLRADLLSNLQAFPGRIAVGDPDLIAADGREGPKGIASADFNGDTKPDLAVGNLDGTITVLISQGGGRFGAPRHVRTEAKELRSVLAADLNGDGKPDLAAASPQDGQLMVFFNVGAGSFAAKTALKGWLGVRSLASGDFDGDGIADLAAAGPGLGVRHFRGTGGGTFEIMGDLPRLGPPNVDVNNTRPVYSMHTLRSRDGLRDDLLVTHAFSPSLWILSTVPVDRSNEPPVDLSGLPAWGTNSSPVLITEVQVQNTNTLRDADGTPQPWVELLNRFAAPVNLAGWKLQLQSGREWIFPALTVQPGRFLVVFLSGKDRRTGPEPHTSFRMEQSTDTLNLYQPTGVVANAIDLPTHTVTDVSRGMAPDSNAVKWFEIPSPGVENNAGLGSLDDLSHGTATTLTITPRQPLPEQPVTVRVKMPEQLTGASSVRNVWFSATPGLFEVHHLMHRVSPGIFQEVLAPGSLSGSTPHRVLARLRDATSNDITVQIHPGLDELEVVIAVPPRPGCLLPVASVPSPKVKAFEVGAVTTQANVPGAQEDLVYADDEGGLLRVHRAGSGARRFEPIPVQAIQVRGGARDVKLADTDGDGWLDATAVVRNMDLAAVFKNESGWLRSTGELNTGKSPREAVMADFTGDGRVDAAVINRYSADVSILASAGTGSGLVSLDQIYPVDGEVAALTVKDFNDDGRDDVLQLHRASSEISVRHAGPDGRLSEPVFTSVGAQGASALAVADVNNDGKDDVITANLGRDEAGSISVLLAKAGGSFEAPRVFNGGGGMFAISVADFDSDDNKDVVAGLFDCSVMFFRGDGNGNFAVAYALPVPFVNESRVMVTADFDQDGDIDVAGAGYAGDVVTLENTGAATAESWLWYRYPPPGDTKYGAERIGLTKLNADDDPDLIVGTGHGTLLYQGVPGMRFFQVKQDDAVTGLPYPVSDVFTSDIDGDGALDLVAACRAAACVNILRQAPDGRFLPKAQADVPSARYLATGDVDGDGQPDLVGTGDVLWTVLSSRPPKIAAPGSTLTLRPRYATVVINEVLARNTGVPVPADNDQKTDYVELFNGSGTPAVLTGWKLHVRGIQEGMPLDKSWALPSITIGANSHAVVIFAPDSTPPAAGSMHTGFTLPAEGGTLTLLKPDNSESDRVVYPHAQENVSWSRFLDGHPTFHADGLPSPGLSNVDNGRVPPEVKLTPPSPASMRAGQEITFTARGHDDLGIISMSLIWNRLDAPLPTPQRLNLFDDGRHDDGGAVDGFFAGTLSPGLPAGAEVQFYLEAVDLSGEVLRLPETAELSAPGDPPVAWSFAIADPPTLEISDVCFDNVALLRDETGGHPDYVRVHNTGAAPVEMSRILLAKSPLSDGSAVYAFPSGLILPPGGEITVFADGNPAEGPLHAPFAFDAGGDDVSLLAVMPSGARQWIHSLTVPEAAPDSKYVRLPGTDLRAVVTGTADLDNWSGTAWDANGVALATVRFPTVPGSTYSIEGDAPGTPAAWALLETVTGDGSVHTVTRPMTQMAALRAVTSPLAPAIRLDAAIGGILTAGIFGEARGVTALALYYGKTDGGAKPSAWSEYTGSYSSLASSTFPFSWLLDPLTADTLYYYRVRAEVPGGGVIWSAPGTTLRTLNQGADAARSLALTGLYPTSAAVQIYLNTLLPPDSSVELLAGTVDASSNVGAWQHRFHAIRPNILATWTANLSGLARGTDYFVRAVVTTSSGQIVSAPRLTFRTPNAKENLARNLLPSEVMYNPALPTQAETAAGFEADDFEFIELQNASDEGMDLSGLWFTGIGFDFPPSGAPVLPPGGFAVIGANPHAFAMRYGADIPLAGWTLNPFRTSKLANSGEGVSLRAADGRLLFDMSYTDRLKSTDGGGFSLEYRGPVPYAENYYDASRITGGSPGWAPPPAQTYDEWQAFHFSQAQIGNPVVSGMNADPDLDGLTNFAEYACGTSALVSDSKDVLRIRDGGQIRGEETILLTFPVNPAAKDVKITLEGKDKSLTTWSPDVLYSSPTGYSQGSCLSQYQGTPYASAYNYLSSSVLSADGKQILVTVAIVPRDASIILGGGPVVLKKNESRLFRLNLSKP